MSKRTQKQNRKRNLKRKVDAVRKACKSFGTASIAIFRDAYKAKFGELNAKAARRAHEIYQRLKKIPSWVASYIDAQFKLRAARPAPA